MKKTLITIILIAFGIVLVFLIAPVPQVETPTSPTEAYSFTTTNNISGSLRYLDKDYDIMSLEFNGNLYTLKRASFASGIRYANDENTVGYSEHQGEARVEVNESAYVILEMDKAEILAFHIEPERVDCIGVGPMKCLVVNRELFYDEIQDFEFIEGTTYDLEVLRTERENTLADANTFHYRKRLVVQQSSINTEGQEDCDIIIDDHCDYDSEIDDLNDIHYDELTLHPWQWIETQYPEGEIITSTKPSQFVAQFGTDGKFYSSTDCNSISGEYTSDDGSIFFDHLVATEMGCMGETLEQSYSTMIAAAKGYTITPTGNLLIRLVTENTTMVFSPALKEKNSEESL